MARLARLFVVLVVLNWMLAVAAAGNFEDGLAAYNRGDYGTAVKLWQPLAEKGDAAAQNNLGVLYAEGHGVPQDYVEALKWFRAAAAAGYSQGLYNLGLKYDCGQGVDEDDAEAAIWYRLAAEQGHAQALHNLGHAWAEGKGVPRDLVNAYMWMGLAVEQGHREAGEHLNELSALLSPEELAKARELTARWDPKPGSCGRPDAVPAPKWSEAVRLRDFSVMTPVGGGWCIIGPNWFRSIVQFGKVIKEGKTFEQQTRDEQAHTFLAVIGIVDVEGDFPQGIDGLVDFTEKWAGTIFKSATQWTGKLKLYAGQSNDSERERFNVIKTIVNAENRVGLECAKFYQHAEETRNSRYPGETLIMESLGYLCLSPYSRDELLHVFLSERYIKNRRAGPSYILESNPEVQSFFLGFRPKPK